MKKWIVWMLCGLSVGLNAETKVQTLRLALNWKPEPEFGGFYDAALRGIYQKEGIQLEILPGGVGTPVIQMVEAGKVEMGISNADEVILEAPSISGQTLCPMKVPAHRARGSNIRP